MFDPAEENYVNLATRKRNGEWVRTPVWIAGRDGLYYVFSEGKAGKVKRIRNFSDVQLAPCDIRGNVRGEWIDATARLVTDPSEIDAAYAGFTDKYGWQMRLGNVLSKVSGRFDKRAMIAIETCQLSSK